MQLGLNEFLEKLKLPPVTSSAFSQARLHLSHQAFIELNEEAIVKVCYSDGAYKRYKGYRVLGVDGSKIYLPAEEPIIAEFGGSPKNQHSAEVQPFAIASVMYDLLNRIAVDSEPQGACLPTQTNQTAKFTPGNHSPPGSDLA